MARQALEFSRQNTKDADPVGGGISTLSVGQEIAALPFLLEDFAGLATYRGKPIYNHEQVIGQLDSGAKIGGKTITYSFFDGPHTIGIYNNPNNGFPEPEGYSPFSEAEKAVG